MLAYHWRHNQLQKEISQPTTLNNSNTTIQNVPTSELGDLSVFRKITEDTRNLVVANNMDGARTRISDLEHEWDIAQLKLKAMNGTKWTKVDDAIDKVLRSLRAVNPVQNDCKTSLDKLLTELN